VKLPKVAESIMEFIEGMTPRGLLLLSAVAGLLAFGLFFLVLSSIMPDKGPENRPDMAMVKVVTVKRDIPVRTELKEEMLQVIEMPKSAVPEDAIKDINVVLGKPVRSMIFKGDILTGRKLFPDQKEAGFTGTIPANCRAISLAIDDVTGVAGFALPGDYVDVMTVSDKVKDGKVTGEILLQNVLLLSINKITDAANAGGEKDKNNKDGGKTQAVDSLATATLAVLPEEALRLMVASQTGKVYLVLRPFRPAEPYIIDTNYTITLNQGKKAETAPAAPMPVSAPVSAPAPAYTPPAESYSGSYDASYAGGSSIEVIRGTQFSK